MTSHNVSAREIIEREILGRSAIAGARYATQELDAAGLLVTPKHDAAVAARVLRDVVEVFEGDHIDLIEELRWSGAEGASLGWTDASVYSASESTSLIGPWLAARADRIEREGGASDADT